MYVFWCFLICVQGMVDPGELVSQTLQREFAEEALNFLQASPEERKQIHERISKLFRSPSFEVRNLPFFPLKKKNNNRTIKIFLCRIVFFFFLGVGV